jgi:hypothetical protein
LSLSQNPPTPNKQCQCTYTACRCVPCEKDMDAEDLLCAECRADGNTGRVHCHTVLFALNVRDRNGIIRHIFEN